MVNNKIKYGIRNCYYAPRTESTTTSGTYLYGTPVALPGAVSISLAAEGESTSFYADDIEYFRAEANNGYSGDLVVAILPDAFRQYALGETKGTDNVLYEDADAFGGEFALGFEIQGNDHNTLFWFYNCVASRPETAANTKESSIEPETDTVTIACRPDEDHIVRGKTTDDTATAVTTAWFTAVHKEA